MDISSFSILVSLIILTVLVYKRVNIALSSIICCVFVALISSMPLVKEMMPAYLAGFAGFVRTNFLVFSFSALFGKLMEDSGAAFAIANLMCRFLGEKKAFYGAMLATSILSYGGVSVFVIAFAVYPIFLSIAQQTNIPRQLLPAAICAASVTYAEAFFPGAAQIHNIIPTTYLGTTPMAGAIVGSICGVLMMVMLYFYFEYEINKARKSGAGFQADGKTQEMIDRLRTQTPVNGWLALVPIAILLFSLNVLKFDVVVCMILGAGATLALFWKNISDKLESVNLGMNGATGAIIATSAVIAFGAVMKETSGYQTMIDWVKRLDGSNPLAILGATSTIISGITGSGIGGISFTMEIFTDHFVKAGVNPEMFHRIVTMAGVGLDSLPHNGLIVTTLTICGMTHKESYKYMFVTTLLMTCALLVLAMYIGPIFYPNLPPVH